MRDIIIIGAGVIGCAVARELSRYSADVLVLERGNDVSVGASKANSGIVHAGFDAKPHSKKAQYNVRGNAMFPALAKELDFPFKQNGSLVLCFDESQKDDVYALYRRGIENGVPQLSVIEGNENIRAIEPNVSTEAVAALVAPTGGIVSPYELAIAFAENAAHNGVCFEFNQKVIAVSKQKDVFTIKTEQGMTEQAKVVVNCAGVYSDEINNLLSETHYQIVPRKGDYVLMDKRYGNLCSYTLFQLPTQMGKGVLVSPTVHGNILVGPTATDVPHKDDVDTTAFELNDAFTRALQTIPSLSKRTIITQFSGLRAHGNTDDFIIGESADVANLFNACGIESPGLTSSPAIGQDMAQLIAQKLQLNLDPSFDPTRKAIPHFASMSNQEREQLIQQNASYGKIICRCEMVTEGEIVEAIHRTPGAKDLDGIKRRTRAGMGRCQAGFCTAKIMEILARELGIDMTDVTKRGSGSEILVGRTHE